MSNPSTITVHPIKRSEGTFAGSGVTLFRRSVQPTEKIVARLGIIHGYGEHSGRYTHFMQWLAERGIASSALDLRGQGQSTGRRGYVVRWEEYLDDLRAFLSLDELRQGDRQPPLFLLAHSHGALILTSGVLRGIALPRGVIFSSPFFRSRMQVPAIKVAIAKFANRVLPWMRIKSGIPNDWLSHDPAMTDQSKNDPLVCKTATPRWWFTHQVVQRAVRENAGQFSLPMLLQWGAADPLADESTARDFFDRASSVDKTFLKYPDMLHEILRETEREKVFEDVRRWIIERSE